MDPINCILLTIDVEDWFQVENFKPWIPYGTWDRRELRVEKNVHRLLNLFDSFALPSLSASKPQAERRPKATFFVLGWIADRMPSLIREIQSRGHEIASHGYHHELPSRMSAFELKIDLTDSKKRLEDIIGSSVCGYRAPSFAIQDSILKNIEDCGYRYDSSYNSFGLHSRYGRISLNGAGKFGIAFKLSDNFYELPVSNLSIKNPLSIQYLAFSSERNVKKSMVSKSFVLPFGGGAYFRLIPLPMFNLGINSILQKEGAYIFYLHPWELDPDQPRLREASMQIKLRHYINLNKTKTRLKRLIENFRHCRFVTCSRYLELNGKH